MREFFGKETDETLKKYRMYSGLQTRHKFTASKNIRWWERVMLWFVKPVVVVERELVIYFKRMRGCLYVIKEESFKDEKRKGGNKK